MKEFAVCGIGNAIVDLFVGVSEDEFATLGFERGTMRLVDAQEQKGILEQFRQRVPRLVSGGSVANSVIGFSQLGGRAAFIGVVGDDRYGLHYQEEFQQLGIDMGAPVLVGQTTGTCACVITPDAERTMRTCLAVNGLLDAGHVDAERIKKSEWLFVEGYLLANPGTGQEAVAEAVRVAKQNGVKVALTCSEAFIVHAFGDAFFKTLTECDFLFSNATEAMAVTKADSAEGAFDKLKVLAPGCVVTDGPHGAHVRYAGAECHVPAFPCDPQDLTGAGDMFAGAFLYGITKGLAPDAAARGANFLSSKVISQIGARLHAGAPEFWAEATQGK